MDPGAPVVGAPDAPLCFNRLPPIASKPASLTKLASSKEPTMVGVVAPD